MNINKKYTSLKSGFTLIEIVVAIGILSIVLMMGVGLLVVLLSHQRRTINIQNVHDNARFAIEAMSREIRTGDSYCAAANCIRPDAVTVTTDCSWSGGGCGTFTFRQASTNEIVVYRLSPVGPVVEVSRNGGIFLPLTDPQRAVTRLRFYATGITNPSEQAKVTIIMEVEAGSAAKPDERATTQLQTTISKRKLIL